MRIATSMNICLGRWSEDALIPRLAAAGFEGIDFNFLDMATRLDWHDPPTAEAWLAKLAQAAADNDLPWVQAHGPMFDPALAGELHDRGRALCGPAIRACGRLGVPWMVLHPAVARGAGDAADIRLVHELNVTYFRSLLDECERANVGLALENLPQRGEHGGWRVGYDAEMLCALIDAIDHPLVGACWDTGHARLMDTDQYAAITMLGSRLKALHIQENDGQADDHMLPFANGRNGVDWQAVMRGLREAEYAGTFTYETHNAFLGLPDALFDPTLRHSVAVARHLIGCWGEAPAATASDTQAL